MWGRERHVAAVLSRVRRRAGADLPIMWNGE
jgi:hypothetical protein